MRKASLIHRALPAALLAFFVMTAFPLAAFSNTESRSANVSVSLKNDDLPADDLVLNEHGQSRILSPSEAWKLKTTRGMDLSKLNPDPTSDIWTNSSTATTHATDDALAIASGAAVSYAGEVASSAGVFRFNVQSGGQTLTLMLARNLHTYLLRKELLRKLGYKIPAMKFLKTIRVQFADELSRDFFLKSQITEATLGVASRWQLPGRRGADALEVSLQDVVAMEATPLFYNVALAPPIETMPGSDELRPETHRILRALAIPYGLANVDESLNQLDWYIGRITNGAVTFPVADDAIFGLTLDDALWMCRLLSSLTRADYEEIVAGARFPKEVAAVLVEKLISRRNSLLSTFKMSAPPIAFNAKINIGKSIVDGKVIQQDWPGYASRYAIGDPDSPLKGLQYYVLAEAQSTVLTNLLSKAQSKIPYLTVNPALQGLPTTQGTQSALTKYLLTGVSQRLHLGFWIAPVASGGVDISRDVVLGNYLGTNNLVQLVDTFGFHANAGLMAGVIGLPDGAVAEATGLIQGTMSISMAHLKPLTELKDAIKEPLRGEFVPWVAQHASGIFHQIHHVEATAGEVTPDLLKTKLAADLESLKGFIGVGESLILTQSLSGTQNLTLSATTPTPIAPLASVQGGTNEVVISRLQIYRKDETTILVFKDDGQLKGVNVGFSFGFAMPQPFPIFSIEASAVAGSADSRVFNVDITPDPASNPNLYASAGALSAALKTGSVELLASVQKPTDISVSFHDRSSSLKFFSYVRRTLRTEGKVSVALPDGNKQDFISLSDGKQSGQSYQGEATTAATFLMQELSHGTLNVSINTTVNPNPGQTFMGHSQTRQAEFQGQSRDGLSKPYVGVQYRWEGWSMDAKKLEQLVAGLNARYGLEIYSSGFLGDAKKLQMYKLLLSVNLYKNALNHIMKVTPAQESDLVRRYHCEMGAIAEIAPRCFHLSRFRDDLKIARKGVSDPTQLAALVLDTASHLEQFATFNELVAISGGPGNLYLNSVITGFEVGSETLSEPIYSNTYGTADPKYPAGVLQSVQQQLGIASGEFNFHWLRDRL